MIQLARRRSQWGVARGALVVNHVVTLSVKSPSAANRPLTVISLLHVCHIISHTNQRTISGICNLRTLLTIQLLTYKDVSVRKLSHRTCLCATCHTMSYVLSRPPCFHAVCRLGDVFECVFAHKNDVCLHTFRIRKT